MANSRISYFLGANTPNGFYSMFDSLCNAAVGDILYIIKGGPGTGKSTLMRRVAAALDDSGYECEYIYCSSDPGSLDAIRCQELGIALCDGTAPHVTEPKYPGAVENLIDLGTLWNTEGLRKRKDEIIALSLAVSEQHRRCTGYLAALGSVENDTIRFMNTCINRDKIERYAQRVIAREFPLRHGQRRGNDSRALLSAVTPDGIYVHYNTFLTQCERFTVIDDTTGGLVPSLLLELLRESANAAGWDTRSYMCPLNPEKKTEHLVIPGLGLGFFTSNRFHPSPDNASKHIRSSRFLNADLLAGGRRRLSFNAHAASELLCEAVRSVQKAKKLHDELEKIYVQNMNFNGMESLINSLLCRISEHAAEKLSGTN